MATALVTVVLTSALAWLVGTEITYRWDDAKRRRELDLAAVADFYKCYGTFLQIWRIWNAHKQYSDHFMAPDDVQWQCMQNASEVEGDLESLLIKLISERRLSDKDLELLGCFREAYQSLRERIRVDQPLEWYSRVSEQSIEFRQYRAFKFLAMYAAGRLQSTPTRWPLGRRGRDVPRESDRVTALLAITLGTRRDDWLIIAEQELNQLQQAAQHH